MASTLQTIPPGRELFEPRAKLSALLSALILLILARSMGALLAANAFPLVLLIAARVPARWVIRRLGELLLALSPFLILLPFLLDGGRTLWEWRGMRITDAGLIASAILLLRSTAIALWILSLLATTAWADGIAAARRLGLPRRPAGILLLTHRYMFILYGELSRLRTGVRVRGFRNRMDAHSRRTVGHLVGALFARGFDRAENLQRALAARGFTGDLPGLHQSEFRWRDRLFVFGAFLFHSILLIGDWSIR